MKEFLLMNKKTGEVGFGIRLSYFDHPDSESIANLDGFRISISSTTPDIWAIQSDENEPWFAVRAELLCKVEILGEL